jgi:hypothetical protein
MSESGAPSATEIRRLLDRVEIQQLLNDYCRACDRCDEDLLRSLFHEDATEDHGGLHAGTAASFCDMAIPLLRSVGPTTHIVANLTLDFEASDIAHGEAYGVAFHRVEADGEQLDSIFAVRVLDRYERRMGRWKIAHRRIVYDWNRDTPARSKDRSDPSYRRSGKGQ